MNTLLLMAILAAVVFNVNIKDVRAFLGRFSKDT